MILSRGDKYRYTGLVVLAVGLFFYYHFTAGSAGLRDIKLTEAYALLGAACLYLALLAGPWYRAFPNFPGSILPQDSGRLWVGALVFGLLHVYFAFFKLLGGFGGLPFLTGTYIWAIVLSLFALLIIVLMSLRGVTLWERRSNLVEMRSGLPRPDQSVGARNDRYAWFYYLGYIAGVCIIIHAYLIGSHFHDRTSTVSLIAIFLIYILAVLVAREITVNIGKKYTWLPVWSGAWIVTVIAVSFITFQFAVKTPGSNTFMPGHNMSMMAGGSKIMKHYSVNLSPVGNITAGQATELELKVFDAATGSPITTFDTVHEKLVHLVIVNESLDYYEHIHPEWKEDRFTVTADFSKNAGAYRAYVSFQPRGDSEQTFGFRFIVGENAELRIKNEELRIKSPDSREEKQVENVKISLREEKLNAADIVAGKAYLNFTLSDAASGQPLTNLYPYLGAFGHVVMISASDYSYTHVHPIMSPSIPDEKTGPEVRFMVMGNLQPGIYKLFAQFAPDKKVIAVPFVVEVKP